MKSKDISIDRLMCILNIEEEQRETFILYMDYFAAAAHGTIRTHYAFEYKIRYLGTYNSVEDYTQDRFNEEFHLDKKIPEVVYNAIDWKSVYNNIPGIVALKTSNNKIAVFYSDVIL